MIFFFTDNKCWLGDPTRSAQNWSKMGTQILFGGQTHCFSWKVSSKLGELKGKFGGFWGLPKKLGDILGELEPFCGEFWKNNLATLIVSVSVTIRQRATPKIRSTAKFESFALWHSTCPRWPWTGSRSWSCTWGSGPWRTAGTGLSRRLQGTRTPTWKRFV